MISGVLADKLGRKGCLYFNNVFGILGSVLMFSAPFTIHYYLFHMGRCIIGLNVGIGSSVVPMFLTELSPLKWRGAIGTLPQLMVTISILVSQGVGLIFNDRDRFQWIFGTYFLYKSILTKEELVQNFFFLGNRDHIMKISLNLVRKNNK